MLKYRQAEALDLVSVIGLNELPIRELVQSSIEPSSRQEASTEVTSC